MSVKAVDTVSLGTVNILIFLIVRSEVRFRIVVEAFVRIAFAKVGTGHILAVATAAISVAGGLAAASDDFQDLWWRRRKGRCNRRVVFVVPIITGAQRHQGRL